MNTLLKPTLVIIICSTLLSACATKQSLSELEMTNKYQAVISLEQSIANSDKPMLALLSQQSFKLAVDASKKSKALAMKDKHEALDIARQGESYFQQAQVHALKARDVFSEVLDARALAINHGAFTQMPDKLASLEAEFKKMTLELEQGNLEKAKLLRPSIIQQYQSLELTSLKKATVDDAKQQLAKARSVDADKYAKQTFKMAEDELALAASMLDADKSSKEKADQHAAQAIWLAQKSISITETVKSFKANDFTQEEIVLWHQSQLDKALKPLGMTLPLNLADKNLIESIAYTVGNSVNEKKELTQQRDELKTALLKRDEHLTQAMMTNQQEQLALKSKYEDAQKQRDETEAQKRQKLEFIQGLFTPQEANVYREKNDILIRAQGFYFASGQSEIDSRNFPILQKISSAIAQYPSSNIMVTGHTDDNGNDAKNLSLSKLRADKVTKFLNEVGGISLERLSSEGLGELKPVASNATQDGRAENRRVEILIINK